MSSYIINNTNINYNRNKICNQTAASLLELDSNIPYNIFIRNLKSLKAGQVVVNFDIILEKNRIIFHGSRDDSKIRTVRGKVRLEVAGKLNVKEIILSLVGDYNISLDLMNDISSSLSPSSPTSSTSSLESLESSLPEKQGTVFSSSILLENKRVLLSGIHEFHFEFLLPGDLSESMNSDAVLCKYFLKAELMTRFPSELSTDNNKSVDIVDLFIERAFLESDDDITNGLRPTRFIGGNNDLLDFEFILPKIMKLNSNSIEFIGRWDGFNRVDKISFCFVQSECYNIANNGCIVHNEKSIAGPFCFQLPKNEPLRLQSRPTIFKLPICESFVNDYDLVNIKIRHQLDVKIQLNNFKKDQIEFSIPISVKSIIPNQDTLPLPHKIDLSNSVACLQLGNEIYTSKPSKEANIINKQPIFKSPSIIFNNVNNREINVSHNMNISTNTDSNVTRQSKPLPNIRKQLLQFLSRKTSIQSKKSSSKKSLPINIESKIFNNDDDGNDNDNDIINNINNNSNSDSNGSSSSSSNIINNKIMNNLCNSRISTITEASSEFSIENVAIIEEEEEEEEDDDDEYIENINHDIEYDNDDADDIKANDTIITAATATTYTDNNFNVKEFHKPDFITSSANIIAENFIKFNYLLHKRHHQNNKDNINKTNNFQQQYKNHHKPPPKSHQNKSHQNKSLKRNSRISRASSTSTCVQPDVKDYIKHSTHYKSDNNNNNIINDNIIIS